MEPVGIRVPTISGKFLPHGMPGNDKPANRICRKCFEGSKIKEQTRAPPLPGTILPGRMVRISKDIGRCSVCNIGYAVYHDREIFLVLKRTKFIDPALSRSMIHLVTYRSLLSHEYHGITPEKLFTLTIQAGKIEEFVYEWHEVSRAV